MSDHDPDPTRVEQATVAMPPTGDDSGGGPVPPGGDPLGSPAPPPPPDRRIWIIVALLAVIALLLVLLLVFQDDDDGDDASSTAPTSSSSSTSSSTSEPTSSTSTSTSSTVAPTTTAPPVVTVPPEECAELGEGAAQPGLAAGTVYDAWVRGDEACAAELMTPGALAELFDRDGTGADHTFQGCSEQDVPDPHVDCAFTYEGGATHYLMNFSATDGWQIFEVTQVAD